MVHVTCDVCGKALQPGEEHFVVKIEVFAAHDPSTLTEADLDEDHMEAVGELLRQIEDEEVSAPLEPTSHNLRYELCPDCRGHYLRDPLSKHREPRPKDVQKFDFSEN